MRKKLISLLLTGVLTASLLAGCGSTDNSNSAASENTAAVEETASAEEAQEAVDLSGTETRSSGNYLCEFQCFRWK